jgi:quercetin dioxygenase-like cupin family protein
VAEGRLFEAARPERYSGVVEVARLVGSSDDTLRVYEVRFAPGARTVWHVHAGRQWLIGLIGESVIQCTGAPPRRLAPGDAAEVPAGVRHWHGAVAGVGSSHLVVNVVAPTEWAEPVGEDEYRLATASTAGAG